MHTHQLPVNSAAMVFGVYLQLIGLTGIEDQRS